MADLTKKELEVLLEEANQKNANLQTELSAAKNTIADKNSEIEGKQGEIDSLNTTISAHEETISSLEEDLEIAATQVPAPTVSADGTVERRPGVYLKDNLLFITGFGHVKKEDGPLTEKQLQALQNDFKGSTLTEKQIGEKFFEVVQ